MDKQILQEIKEKLEKNKELLEKELQSFATSDGNLKGDWDTKFPEFNNGGNLEEAADEVEEYEARLPIEHNLELRLRDTNLALEKIRTSLRENPVSSQGSEIERGIYGKCENCGKEIPAERLEIYPEARLCLNCKK